MGRLHFTGLYTNFNCCTLLLIPCDRSSCQTRLPDPATRPSCQTQLPDPTARPGSRPSYQTRLPYPATIPGYQTQLQLPDPASWPSCQSGQHWSHYRYPTVFGGNFSFKYLQKMLTWYLPHLMPVGSKPFCRIRIRIRSKRLDLAKRFGSGQKLS